MLLQKLISSTADISEGVGRELMPFWVPELKIVTAFKEVA